MVPLVAIPLIFLGIAIYAIGLGLTSMLPHVHCGRVTRFAISGVLFLLALPVGMWCMSQGSRIPIIVLAYGYDEYAAGLWIINKHGDLSDGRTLSDFWNGVWGAMIFLSLPVAVLPLCVFQMLSDGTADSEPTTANKSLQTDGGRDTGLS